MGEEVGAQTEAENGDIVLVHQRPELVDLRGSEKLTFVGDDHVPGRHLMIALGQVAFRRDGVGLLLQTDAGADGALAVAGIHRGLDEPDRHAQLLIIELCDQGLGGFGAAHGAVFEIKLRHAGSLLAVSDLIIPQNGKNVKRPPGAPFAEKALEFAENLCYNAKVIMQGWYIGITPASQAGEAGSTPVPCSIPREIDRFRGAFFTERPRRRGSRRTFARSPLP